MKELLELRRKYDAVVELAMKYADDGIETRKRMVEFANRCLAEQTNSKNKLKEQHETIMELTMKVHELEMKVELETQKAMRVELKLMEEKLEMKRGAPPSDS